MAKSRPAPSTLPENLERNSMQSIVVLNEDTRTTALRRLVQVFSFCAVALALPGEARAESPQPDGALFEVASLDFNTGGGVAMDAAGNFVVTWNQFIGGPAARGFTHDGEGESPFLLEPYGDLSSSDPMDQAAVAVDDFVFVWESTFTGLHARRYSHDGSALAPAFQVTDSGATFLEIEPAIAHSPSTPLMVVWASDNPSTGDPDGFGIQARAFDTSGTALAPVFQVNAFTAGDQQAPDIAMNAFDWFVVWQSEGSSFMDDDGSSIQAHRYVSGASQARFEVNEFTPGDQTRPAVAMAPNGGALVVWQGPSPEGGSDTDVRGRAFDFLGDPLGPEFRVNTGISGTQSEPAVAWAGTCFVVVWRSTTGVFGQAVTLGGERVGPELTIQENAPLQFLRPTVAGTADGRSIVSWEQSSLTSNDVMGQRLRQALFANGFESGGTTAWSLTVP